MTARDGNYHVLLADDEPLFRLALRTLLSESGLPLKIVGEASDGQEALHWVRTHRDLDIVIVDMKMPGMSGIDFLNALSDWSSTGVQDELPVSIVLSAYQDYSLVRQAFLLGALDYIVKVDLDKSHVIPVLKKAIRELDKRKNGYLLSSGSKSETKDIVLKRVLEDDSFEALEACRKATVSLPEHNRAMAVIRSDGHHSGQLEQGDLIRQTLEQALQANGIQTEIIKKEEREYVVFIGFGQNRSLLYCRNRLNEALATIQRRLLQYANVTVSVGVTGPHIDVSWANMYHEAKKLAALLFFCGYGKVFYPETAKTWHLGHSPTTAGEAEFTRLGKSVLHALTDPDPDLWCRTFADWKKAGVPWRDEEEIRARFIDYVWDIGVILHGRERRWEQLEQPYLNPLLCLQQCETLEQLWNVLEELLLRVHKVIHETPEQGNGILQKAKAYIAKHYSEGITLTLISKMVGISESHLSKLFVKETGEKFIDYLTKIRVNQAIELMKTDMKLYEIAEKVGYLNPEHFSRVFKKTTGLNPAQYREQLEQAQKISRR
ncbi:helix-turn-helix domain-containing protein [Paenibacillus cisolokensis]|uniref:response regulator transcription factor n=1 Tax=Paenibacillus cisolokensis TaxID=1658519 RepID=UPI003D2D658A